MSRATYSELYCTNKPDKNNNVLGPWYITLYGHMGCLAVVVRKAVDLSLGFTQHQNHSAMFHTLVFTTTQKKSEANGKQKILKEMAVNELLQTSFLCTCKKWKRFWGHFMQGF